MSSTGAGAPRRSEHIRGGVSRTRVPDGRSLRSPADRAEERRGGTTPDDELAARLRLAVTRLNRRLRQESFTGVSPPQEAALGTIHRLGAPTLGELAQAERVRPPSMTAVVSAMEAAGLVTRRGDEADRRVTRVELTAEGRATIERIRSLKTAYIARQMARLSPSERARLGSLATLLERLVEGL